MPTASARWKCPPTAAIKRIAPGERDLSAAETIPFSDLAVGDRALVKLDPEAPAGTMEALQIIAVKQSDLALKQQKDREDWQRRGVGGLVKSVDPATGTILLNSGVGATAKTITVHIAKTTILKRYAPGSVRFDAAQPAPIDAIHAGDQLRARGVKNADGTEIAAEEVVSGSFRNIAGTIASLDAAASTLVVKDLATKKPVTIHITAEAQMRPLPRSHGADAGGAAERKRARLRRAEIPGRRATRRQLRQRTWAGRNADRAAARPAADVEPRAGHSNPRSAKRRGGNAGLHRGQKPRLRPSRCWRALSRCWRLPRPARICSPTGA